MTSPFLAQIETLLTGLKPRMAMMISNAIAALNIGAANGLATLGSDAKLCASQIPAAILGALEYQGTWNASTDTPPMPAASSANKGYYYKVSVAGETSIDGIAIWRAGDWIVSNSATWDKVDNTELVTSVAGRIGDIVLSTADISGLESAATHPATDFEQPLTFIGTGVSRTGNTISIIGGGGGGSTTPPPIMHLPLTGANGSQNIIDSTGVNNIQCIGTAAISTAKSCLGTGSSLRINGDGGCLVVLGGSQFNFVSRDCSISFWLILDSASPQQYARLFLTVNGDFHGAISLFFNAYTNDLYFNLSSGGSTFDIVSAYAATLSLNSWMYVEYDRSYQDHYLSVNGNIVYHVNSPLYLYSSLTDLVFGGQSNGAARSIIGNMMDIVILPYCRNTSNFTPPTTPFS